MQLNENFFEKKEARIFFWQENFFFSSFSIFPNSFIILAHNAILQCTSQEKWLQCKNALFFSRHSNLVLLSHLKSFHSGEKYVKLSHKIFEQMFPQRNRNNLEVCHSKIGQNRENRRDQFEESSNQKIGKICI